MFDLKEEMTGMDWESIYQAGERLRKDALRWDVEERGPLPPMLQLALDNPSDDYVRLAVEQYAGVEDLAEDGRKALWNQIYDDYHGSGWGEIVDYYLDYVSIIRKLIPTKKARKPGPRHARL